MMNCAATLLILVDMVMHFNSVCQIFMTRFGFWDLGRIDLVLSLHVLKFGDHSGEEINVPLMNS